MTLDETVIQVEPDSPVAKVAKKGASSSISGEATFEALVKKPRRVLNFTVISADDSGSQVVLSLRYQALSSKVYDDLIEAHPPNEKDKKAGNIYHLESFAPALISAVSLIPRLTVDQATELYTSDSWSGGEVTALYINAIRVCNAGLDVPFNAQD